MNVEIGRRLRRAREARGLSQRQLAQEVSVSASMISQIEAGQSQPSVNTLYAIVTELGVSLDEVFERQGPPDGHADDDPAPDDDAGSAPEDAAHAVSRFPATEPDKGAGEAIRTHLGRRPRVTRPGDRAVIKLDTGVVWEQLSPTQLGDLDFMHVEYDVGGASSRDGTSMRHSGIEFAYIMSGHLAVQVGFDTVHLGPGDAVSYDSSVPHRLWNEGDEPVQAIFFILHR